MGTYMPVFEPLLPRCARCDRGIASHPEGAQAKRGSRTMCVDCVKRAAEPAGPRRVAGITDGRSDDFDEAVCRTIDPDLWWMGAADAKDQCRGCPVRRLCLARALGYGEESGIWGGFDMATEQAEAREWADLMDHAEAVSA